MGNFQYKSGGNWVDVPDYAHPDDEGGSMAVEHPQPDGFNGLGQPCGVVGLPRIVIHAKLLTGAGWAWYQAFFGNTTDLVATVTGLTAYDVRSGTWRKYTGTLLRPTGTVRPGATLARTLYEDVEIIIDGVTETT